ncbi:uncharacterized protein LOC124638133 isoform X2 [Helicoverpa zea]|uniref:uncharacterized protein LOC124638133 isoform X2 n=1 Tax=Helicoverpa zea TaxID=7113 RepID=UPI001F592F8B|nr:uncharacterized protein LOC124638133 isoform X2 [Helicoverpa zea]
MYLFVINVNEAADSKTWRMGQKGRLKLSARRKKLKRSARGYFMNKENIPPVHDTFQQSLQEAISPPLSHLPQTPRSAFLRM